MSYPHLLHPEPLPLWQSTADPYLHRRHSNTILSLCGSLGPGAHKVCLSPLSVWVNSRIWRGTGKPGVQQSMGSQSRTQLSNWTEQPSIYSRINNCPFFYFAYFTLTIWLSIPQDLYKMSLLNSEDSSTKENLSDCSVPHFGVRSCFLDPIHSSFCISSF